MTGAPVVPVVPGRLVVACEGLSAWDEYMPVAGDPVPEPLLDRVRDHLGRVPQDLPGLLGVLDHAPGWLPLSVRLVRAGIDGRWLADVPDLLTPHQVRDLVRARLAGDHESAPDGLSLTDEAMLLSAGMWGTRRSGWRSYERFAWPRWEWAVTQIGRAAAPALLAADVGFSCTPDEAMWLGRRAALLRTAGLPGPDRLGPDRLGALREHGPGVLGAALPVMAGCAVTAARARVTPGEMLVWLSGPDAVEVPARLTVMAALSADEDDSAPF